MSTKTLIVRRPTKIELIRLRRRLALAKRLHRMLRDRLTILVQEYLINLKQVIKLRSELHSLLGKFYINLALTYLTLSSVEMELGFSRLPEIKLLLGYRNVAGVKAIVAEVRKGKVKPMNLNEALLFAEANKIFSVLTELAEVENSLNALGKEIRRTKRRVNALEYFLIPKLRETIRYLSMKFEEREREEKSRLKRVKEILMGR